MNTTRNEPDTRNLTSIMLIYAGLLGLSLALPWWLNSNTVSFGLLSSLLSGMPVPMLLLFMVRARTRNWSGITALCMIPFSVIGVMDVIADLDNPLQGLIIAVLSVTVFFAALDAGRRTGLT